MFSSILNNLTLDFAKTQKVIKQEFEAFEYPCLGGGSAVCDVEVLTSQCNKKAVIFHERIGNNGTSVTNRIELLTISYLLKSGIVEDYQFGGRRIKVFESYRYKKGEAANISSICFSADPFLSPNWTSITAEELITWLNNEGTSLNDL